MNVYLDIETVPEQPLKHVWDEIAETIKHPSTMSKPETIEQWHNGEGKYKGAKQQAIADKYRATALNGAKGEIISIAYAIDNGPVISCARSLSGSESEIIEKALVGIYAAMPEGQNPFFIGHHIAGFDLKFLWQRCVIKGLQPPYPLPFHGRHGLDYYCTQLAWQGFKENISLDDLCKALKIEGKPDHIDGSKVWDYVLAGKIDEVEQYNCDDIELVRKCHQRMTFR